MKSNDNGDQVWKGSDVIAKGILSLDVAQANLAQKWQGTDMDLEQFVASKDDDDDGDEPCWISFTNEKLATLLYPNICRTLGDSYTAFRYVHDVDSFSWMQQQSIRALGSLAMYMAASRVKSTFLFSVVVMLCVNKGSFVCVFVCR